LYICTFDLSIITMAQTIQEIRVITKLPKIFLLIYFRFGSHIVEDFEAIVPIHTPTINAPKKAAY